MSRDASEVREAGVPYRGDHAVRDGAGNRHAISGEEGVPEGYKRTEVGVIPGDWGVRRLETLLKSPPKNGYSGRTGNDGGGTATLTLSATSKGRLVLNDHTIKYLRELIPSNSDLFLKYGDVLVQRSNTAELVGSTALFTGPSQIYVYPDLIIRLRFTSPVIAQWFWRYANSWSGRRYFQTTAAGSAGSMPKISGKRLLKMALPFPPSSEQRAIAEALSDADRLIESLDKLIAKKRAVKQAAMQQLLTGKTRLPGFSGEWETKRLGEVAEIYSGGTPSTQVPEFWDGDIPWCTPTDITASNDKYLFSTATRISKSGLARSGATMLPRGALLLCSRATVGEVKIAAVATCTNQGFKSLVCRPGCHNEFLFYLVLTLKGKFVEKASGSTFLEVGREGVSSIVIPMPQYGEQTAIANVLSDIDAEIDALEKRRDKAKAVKQGMMQELLTGRIRLVKPETTAAS